MGPSMESLLEELAPRCTAASMLPHPETSSPTTATTCANSGDLAHARELIEEAEAGYRALLGPAPVATGMLANTGLIMQAAGERAEAISMFESALAGLTATLGPDHPGCSAAPCAHPARATSTGGSPTRWSWAGTRCAGRSAHWAPSIR